MCAPSDLFHKFFLALISKHFELISYKGDYCNVYFKYHGSYHFLTSIFFVSQSYDNLTCPTLLVTLSHDFLTILTLLIPHTLC
jgi:hypothetical protein